MLQSALSLSSPKHTAERAVRLSLTSAVLLLVAGPAMAQAAAPGSQPSALMQLVPFVVVLGVMYFLMIRPQMNKQKAHQNFVSEMKRGDEVVTSGGILGRIEGLTDLFVTLEIAPGVRIKVLKSQVASNLPPVSAPSAEVKS